MMLGRESVKFELEKRPQTIEPENRYKDMLESCTYEGGDAKAMGVITGTDGFALKEKQFQE